MGVMFVIVVGAIFGWLAAIIMRIEEGPGVMRNVAIGIAGAFIAGAVLSPLLGSGNLVTGHYEVGSLLLAVCGAIAVLFAASLLHRRKLR